VKAGKFNESRWSFLGKAGRINPRVPSLALDETKEDRKGGSRGIRRYERPSQLAHFNERMVIEEYERTMDIPTASG
jgi:hypothetical protein